MALTTIAFYTACRSKFDSCIKSGFENASFHRSSHPLTNWLELDAIGYFTFYLAVFHRLKEIGVTVRCYTGFKIQELNCLIWRGYENLFIPWTEEQLPNKCV